MHIYPNTEKSLIDRKQFDKWRGEYWKGRAKGFTDKKIN
ncbi:hypothetical protein [Bartonella sp. B17]